MWSRMNDHPQDAIPAFVLGALDVDDAIRVAGHLAACPACRAEAEAFQASLAELPSAEMHRPPARVKRYLLARVAASAPAQRSWHRWWLAWVMAGALALMLGFWGLGYGAYGRVAALEAQLASSNLELVRLQQQLTHDQQLARFVSAPQTLARQLVSADRRASAVMYMQTDNRHAVLVVRGLDPAAPGTTYQFWLANADVQVPLATFDVAADGMATLAIDAPAAMNHYQQVMVTIEHAGGSQHPSQQVVLSGGLS
jgi:anti-sigma factor RsiW